ncbi:GTPase-activating protein-like isoform X3 [Bolinopsis microptera]|uniref:GTPase-activating protein-like isoform X3 n=1 Tax=Bolinopsis microptera TaxID=2820187 RepID=UPI00307AD812
MSSEIRIRSALRVRIGEAKSLPSKSCRILPGCPNTYCVINLDKEELFETEIVYGTPWPICWLRVTTYNAPFFCEQFEFEIPRAFWTIGFHLITTDTTFSITNVSTIGKVTFTKDQLSKIPNKDQWYGLKSVKCDSEAQGKANVAMCIATDNNESIILQVRLKECANLYMSDLQKVQPYAVLEIVGPNNSIRSRTQETKTLRRSTNMQWKSQTYEFKLNDILKRCNSDLCNLSLKVDFFHHNGVFREGTFLGEVIAGLANVSHSWSDRWYFLCPKLSDIIIQPNHDLGSLRLKIEYKEDHILPSTHYEPLLQLLVNSLNNPEDIESSVLVLTSTMFNEQLINIAQALVRIFAHLYRVEELLLSLTNLDMIKTSNPNTLFRANSLATKGVDELMKMIGRPYLRRVLKPSLDTIHKENLSCEIDPARLRSSDILECNLDNLTRNIDSVYSAIINSGGDCPFTLSSLFSNLQKQAILHFPDVNDIRYTAVSGFIFLRLFAPAILNPKLFQLQSRRPSRETSRTLTLVSKVIQSLGNLDTHQAGKEKYMEAISQRVLDMKHVNGVKQFLEDVCKTEQKDDSSSNNYNKEGKLVEYRLAGLIGRDYSNKRKKLYRLNDQGFTCLRYDESYTIKRSDIKCVSRVDEDAFGVPHIFQIIHSKGTVYLRANNSVDHFDWITCLTKMCKESGSKVEKYHTGALLHSKWTCCGSKNAAHETEGCHVVPDEKEQIPEIDIYRELQRLYQILIDGMNKMETYRTSLQNNKAGDDVELNRKSLQSLNSLIKVIQDLQSTHEHYELNDSGISPGNRHVPLGPLPQG